MKERLEAIREQAIAKIKDAKDISVLNDVRVEILGKKGQLTEVLKGMKDVAPEDRPKVGQLVNDTRKRIEEELENVKKDLEAKAREAKLKAEVIDVTLPAKKNKVGHKHPNTLALEELERIFVGMGYEVVEGPEVEFDHYNFEALNIPENHPAKDEQDTFYINKNIVLRTQTSSVQARVMENTQPPIRIVSPGRVFRSDQVDATHSPSFHQIEGLVIDKNGNGKFDTGNYAEKRQPEDVYYYPKALKLKANWDVEQDWDVFALPLEQQKPRAIVKNKPKDEKAADETDEGSSENDMPFSNQ